MKDGTPHPARQTLSRLGFSVYRASSEPMMASIRLDLFRAEAG
jgi:hypothetical protein